MNLKDIASAEVIKLKAQQAALEEQKKQVDDRKEAAKLCGAKEFIELNKALLLFEGFSIPGHGKTQVRTYHHNPAFAPKDNVWVVDRLLCLEASNTWQPAIMMRCYDSGLFEYHPAGNDTEKTTPVEFLQRVAGLISAALSEGAKP